MEHDGPIDRPFTFARAGLILGGLVELFIAAVFVAITAFLRRVTASSAHSAHPMPPNGALFLGILTSLGAVTFLALAIGTFQASRWARVVGFIVFGSWLTFGAVSLILGWILVHQLGSTPRPAAVAMAVLVVVSVVVPAALLTFYALPVVRAEFAATNLGPGRPGLPGTLVALALFQSTIVFLPLGSLLKRDFWILGMRVSGLPALGAEIVLAAAGGYSAWALLRRRRSGWIVALVMVGYSLASLTVAIVTGEMARLQTEIAATNPALPAHAYTMLAVVSSVVGALLTLTLALLARKHLRRPGEPIPSPATA